jgi:hypothetical protein
MAEQFSRELLVKLDAISTGLRRELSAGSNAVQQFASKTDAQLSAVNSGFGRLGQSFDFIRNGFSYLGVALGVGTFVNLGRSALELADNLADTSEQLGVGVEQLQTYQYAARQVGGDNETVSRGLTKLTTTLGDAVNGSKQAQETFNNLGIAFKNADGSARNTDQIIGDLSDVIASVSDPAQQAAIAAELFGDKAGAKLAAALKIGGGGLKNLQKDLRDTNEILNSETTRALADANQNLENFGNRAIIWGGVVSGAVLKVLNAVKSGGDKRELATEVLPDLDKYNSDLEDLQIKKADIQKQIATVGNINPDQNPLLSTPITVLQDALARLDQQIAQTQNNIRELSARKIELEGGSSISNGNRVKDDKIEDSYIATGINQNRLKTRLEGLNEEARLASQTAQQQEITKQTEEYRASLIKDRLGNVIGVTKEEQKQAEADIAAAVRRKNANQESIKGYESTKKALEGISQELALIGKTDLEKKIIKTQTDAGVSADSGAGQKIADDLTTIDNAAKQLSATKSLEDLQFQIDQIGKDPALQLAAENIRRLQIPDNSEEANQFRILARNLDNAQKAHEEFTRRQDLSKQIIEATRTPLEQYLAQLRDLQSLLDEGSITYDTATRAAEQYKTELEDSDESVKNLKDGFGGFADVIGTAFEDAIIEGGNLRDVLDGLLKDIQRIALRIAVTKPLEEGIGKLFGGILGGFGGGSLPGVTPGASQSFPISIPGFADGGIMTSKGPAILRKYAGGGVASSPQLALFGEGSRPEAFVPLPDGKNIPVTLSGLNGRYMPPELDNPRLIQNNAAPINVITNVTVEGGGGDQKQNQDLARRTGSQVEATVRKVVQEELIKQKRPGGQLY